METFVCNYISFQSFVQPCVLRNQIWGFVFAAINKCVTTIFIIGYSSKGSWLFYKSYNLIKLYSFNLFIEQIYLTKVIVIIKTYYLYKLNWKWFIYSLNWPDLIAYLHCQCSTILQNLRVNHHMIPNNC